MQKNSFCQSPKFGPGTSYQCNLRNYFTPIKVDRNLSLEELSEKKIHWVSATYKYDNL